MAGFDKEHAGEYNNTWRTVRNTFTVDYETPLKGLSAKGMFSYFFANNNQIVTKKVIRNTPTIGKLIVIL